MSGVGPGFDFIVVTPPAIGDPALAIAASRADAIGVLDLQYLQDTEKAHAAVETLTHQARGRCGIKLDTRSTPLNERILADLPKGVSVAILSPVDLADVPERVRALRSLNLNILLEVVSEAEARAGVEAGVDGLIAKGHESGGRIGEETTFVLLQRLLSTTGIPVWAQGGIGLHSVAACAAAGAAGVVLDSQLALTRESTLPLGVKTVIARLDGSETTCVETGAACLRVFAPATELKGHDVRSIGWGDGQLWPIGQEAAFAAPLARRFDRVARILAAFRDAIADQVHVAKTLKPLEEDAPLARAHNTRYPIVQGPMTRVSDRAEFALQVAEGGGLPFLALALMRAPEAKRLLEETRLLLGARPWGVGILGFVPEDLRAEQLELVRTARPSAALIAGGRPDQAVSLERAGIPTYLHVPSPGLLKLFLETGARRFVFEGRECGGHVGPRSSFTLWDAAVETLLAELTAAEMSACHVLFAGGIHDARSASMVAALAAPLAERGAKIGVLLGTAYLFTHEAVASGTIVEGFQREALSCRQTVLLTSGPGHATRCAITPYAQQFAKERRRLIEEGRSSAEVQSALETLNLGRLRIAAKGITRSGPRDNGTAVALVPVETVEQHAEGMYMIGQVAALRDTTCSIEELHHDVSQTSSALLDRLPDQRTGSGQKHPSQPATPFDVAIIGMSCLLPKAPDLSTYWDNILRKVDAVTEVPPDRWDWHKYYDPDPGADDKVNSKWGGFLDPIRFDPAEYGMPPNSLPSIEPLQLLTLATVRAALADAGYLDRELPRDRTSVILGVSGGIADLGQQYAVRSALPALLGTVPAQSLSQLATWSEDSFPGILPNVAAGRVANRFNLGGVNFTVDAACASSLAAVYLACRELEAGTSDMVIVGGADTIQNPFAYLCFGKTHALSPRGRCATFDESADGIAISEGVAMLILKPLRNAERDGDRIYAVIKGVAGSSDGRDKGLTAPRPEGQALALERAYAQAGISPASVGLIEAHGTGTVAGDQAELETLSRVFDAAGSAPQSCAIGSVKSMIGHTKSTAGVAGLIKVALALHHKILPPTIHVSNPNPSAQRSGSALYVNSEARPWVQTDAVAPRRAGVSAFGFGGTNFHAVVEEYTGGYRVSDRQTSSRQRPSELLLWSGESQAAIQSQLAKLSNGLARDPRLELCDLAYTTWQVARNRQRFTLAMVASSLDDLREKVEWAANALKEVISPAALAAKRIFFTDAPLAPAGRVAFLFPGQGSQYPGMLSELSTYFSDVRKPFEYASRVLVGRLAQPLAAYVFPPPRFKAEDRQADMDALTATTVAQPALGAAGLAMYRLLNDFSVHPDMLAGHSYGEYVALWAAGAFDEETLYKLSEARGRCMEESSNGEPGSMAGVSADPARTTAIVNGIGGVWIANLNAPLQTVISGRRDAVEAAIKRLEQAGVASQRLSVACAFHSPLMTVARGRLATAIASVALEAPRLPLFSNVSAEPYPNDAAGAAELLTEQLVRPVRFAEQIQAMYDDGARVFVEVGPGQVLSGLVDQILGDSPHVTVPTDVRSRSGFLQIQQAVGQLAAQGVPVNLDPLFAHRAVRLIDLDSLATGDQETASPTAWTVSGGRAAPLHSQNPARTAAPLPLASEPLLRAQAPSTVPADDLAPAMLKFQQLMSSFLETQKQVMLAYLGGSAPANAVPVNEVPLPAALPIMPPEQHIQPPKPKTDRAANDGDLTEQLLAIVSERTGYPTELLGMDLDVEADLGIDSIKRVEIVGEFGRRVLRSHGVELHEVMTKLTSAKTLRIIADTSRNLIGGAATVAAEQDDVPRFVLAIEDAPRPSRGNPVVPDDLIVIADDGHGIAEQVAASLRTSGAQVELLRGADNLEAIRARHARPISGILHLLPLRHVCGRAAMEAQRYAEEELQNLFQLVQAASADLKDTAKRGRGWVIAATAMGGAFGTESGTDEWVFGHGAIAGFMKTLAVEWPQIRCKVLDLDPNRAADLAERLVGEIECGADFVEVGFRGSRRATLRAVRDQLNETESDRFAIDPQAVLFVTGGARGITAAIAKHLARRYKPTLVIAGRTPLSGDEPPHFAGIRTERELKSALLAEARRAGQPGSAAAVEKAYASLIHQREVRENLQEMRRLGAHVDYRQVDMLDDRALGAVIDDIYRTYGRLDGVIHGAGVIEDSAVERKTSESFARVFDTKVRSALTLVRHVRPESLKFFALFSSVAGRFGNQGQIDYTAANDTLNKLALYLDARWSGRVVSLNWGPWAGVGMAAGAVRQKFIDLGMKPIEIAAGCAAFDRELRCGRKGQVEVVLGQGQWDNAAEPHTVSRAAAL